MVQNWWASKQRSGRRRGRGEVNKKLGRGGVGERDEGERIEMMDRGTAGRRRGTGSSVSSE